LIGLKMKAFSKITGKGQTTIPQEVRELLGLKAGDKVRYVVMGDGVKLIARNRPVTDIFGLLKNYAIPGTTIDDYKNAVAEGISSHQNAVDLEGSKAA
jgi:antitoxin PrlF